MAVIFSHAATAVRHGIVTCLTALLLLGCAQRIKEALDPETNDPIDRGLKLSRQDYKDSLVPPTQKPGEIVESAFDAEPPIPDMSDILIAPRPPELGQDQLVSLSVTEDVPLKDVLIELARLADVDLELDPGISGGIIFRAREKPFNEVIERIADLASLRYSMKNGVLRVEQDTPYVKSYVVDFLNMERSSDSSVTINTNVLSAGEGSSSGDSFNTGSNASITAKSESDLWKSFELGLEKILEPAGVPEVEAVPAAAAPTPTESAEGTEEAAAAAAAPAAPAATAVTLSPTTPETQPFYIVNKQAGVVTVSTTERLHRQVTNFIENLKRSASAQVLIEAKIVEVTLSDEFRSGIDWETLSFGDNFKIEADFNAVTGSSDFVAFNINEGAGFGLDALVQLTETFGSSRTLSSPRLHAINNQQAVLTFAENQVYFEIEVDRETDTTSSTNQELLTVDSEIKTVPIGIILTMQPSINVDTNEVTLNIRPTLSRVTGTVSDPAVGFLASQTTGLNLTNEIPIVEVRELDSILKLQSGQIMVIGGLMEEKTSNTDKGIPVVSAIPWVGNLFKSVDKNTQAVELVIFIKATVMDGQSAPSKSDVDLYRKFTADPRPLTF